MTDQPNEAFTVWENTEAGREDPLPPQSIDISLPHTKPPLPGQLTFWEHVTLAALALGVWLLLFLMCAGGFGAKR